MRKELTEIVFILDKSGSMSGLEKDTIGGYNSMIEKQKKEDGEVIVSTVLFDEKMKVLYERFFLDQMKPMTKEDYIASGFTALLDAMGEAIYHIATIHKYAREEERPEKTLFIIITDGQENASKKYNYHQVKKMVENQKKKYGWEFIFLGANIDAVGEAAKFGIGTERAVNYKSDYRGTEMNYQVMSDTISHYRKKGIIVPEFLHKIKDDCEKRTKSK